MKQYLYYIIYQWNGIDEAKFLDETELQNIPAYKLFYITGNGRILNTNVTGLQLSTTLQLMVYGESTTPELVAIPINNYVLVENICMVYYQLHVLEKAND